jgi:hydrogenase maturation protease
MLKSTLILCLGNEVLSDDAFGPTIAQKLEIEPLLRDDVEVIFAPVAGFALLDLLQHRDRVLVIDSITTETGVPGALHFFPMGQLTPSRNLTTSHQMSLPTAIELGRRMGYEMPAQIDVLAVEIQDATTLCESMTPRVESAIEPAITQVKHWLASHTQEDYHVDRKPTLAAN